MPIVDPTEESLDQEGRTIAEDVCTMTPSALSYFGVYWLIPLDGPTPTIHGPQCTPNPARGYTPHLMVDYHHQVAEIHHRHAQHLYDDPKDLRIEYWFWQPFYFDFYHHLMYLRFIDRQEAPVIAMKSMDTYELGKLKGLDIKQLLSDLRRMGLVPLMEFRKPWNNEIICQFYASYHLDTQTDTHGIH